MITKPNVKVNLGLNVLRKREDGFHDLETLFVPYFGIYDTLEIITGDDYSRTSAALFGKYGAHADGRLVQAISPDGRLMITIAREEGVDWNPLKDLCAKAFFMLAEDFELPSVKIFLEKTSPVGAGLGGGSADAAFTLRMLSDMFKLNLDDDVLASYASRLGSDCAFFVYNRPMIGEGRGEQLTPFEIDSIAFGPDDSEGQQQYELAVVVPDGVSVSTAEAYRGIVPAVPAISLREALARPVEEWKDVLVNDFEKTVFEAHPELKTVKPSLYESGAIYAAMSGSGSAFFGIYPRR